MNVAELSNSIDRTAVNLAAQAAADLEWQRGFGACQFAECSYNDLPNEDQRQGWRAAERAAAEALVADMLERRIARDEYTAFREFIGAW